jgi:hypothetical protein
MEFFIPYAYEAEDAGRSLGVKAVENGLPDWVT